MGKKGYNLQDEKEDDDSEGSDDEGITYGNPVGRD